MFRKDMHRKRWILYCMEMKMAREKPTLISMKLPLRTNICDRIWRNSQHAQRWFVEVIPILCGVVEKFMNWNLSHLRRRATKKESLWFGWMKKYFNVSEMGLDKLIEWFNGLKKDWVRNRTPCKRRIERIAKGFSSCLMLDWLTLHSIALPYIERWWITAYYDLQRRLARSSRELLIFWMNRASACITG